MSFGDWLGKAWNYVSSSWENTTKTFGESWDTFWGAFPQVGAGVKDIASGIWSWDDHFEKGLREVGSGLLSGLTGAIGGTVGTAFQLPVVNWAGAGLDYVYHEGIERPIAAAVLGSVRADNPQYQADERGVWRQAYDDTRYVSMKAYARGDSENPLVQSDSGGVSLGSALTYGIGASLNLNAQRAVDTDPALHPELYSGGSWAALGSTALNIKAAIKLDPTRGGAALYKAAKLKVNPLLAADSVPTYLRRGDIDRLYDAARTAPDSETLRRNYLGNHTDGGAVADVLKVAAGHSDELTARTLFDDAFLAAATGDAEAYGRLVDQAPHIADLMGRGRTSFTLNALAKNGGMTDAEVTQLSSLAETSIEAFTQSLAEGYGSFGAVKKGALMASEMPKPASTVSKMRTGVYDWATYAAPVYIGRPLRVMLGSGFTPLIDLEDNTNGVAQFVGNLERSKLSKGRVNELASMYGRASDRTTRARIIEQADTEAFRLEGRAHGMTAEQVEDALPLINRFRSNRSQIYSTSRRYMSGEAKKAADRMRAQGREDDAVVFDKIAQDVKDGIEQGALPASHLAIIDPDGYLNLLPERTTLPGDKPMMLSQMASVMPMTDWHQLRAGLRWHRWGEVGDEASLAARAGAGAARGTRAVYDLGISTADLVSSAWKSLTLLRPAQPFRNLADDKVRAMGVFGVAPVMAQMSGGIKNAWLNNFTGAGRPWVAAVKEFVTGRKARGAETLTLPGEFAESANNISDLPENYVGSKKFSTEPLTQEPLEPGATLPPELEAEKVHKPVTEYKSYTAALADGVLPVDSYIEAVKYHHEKVGDLPTEEAAAYQAYHDIMTSPNASAKSRAEAPGQLRNQLVDYALTRTGRAAFKDPSWQHEFLDRIAAKHEQLRAEGPIEGRNLRGDLLIDPFTGTEPAHLPGGNFEDHFELHTTPQVYSPTEDMVHDFVLKNVDELLKPRSLLYGYVRPNGNITLAVAKAKDSAVEAGPIKLGARDRMREFPHNQIRDLGHTRFRMETPSGHSYEIHGGFEGDSGDQMMARVSSRGPQDAILELIGNRQWDRLMVKSGGWKTVKADEPHYGATYERVVNAELGSDPIARKYLQGATVPDIIHYLESTKEGQKIVYGMGARGSDYVGWAHDMKGLVDTYAPDGGGSAAGVKLRQAVLDKKARFDDLKAVVKPEELPDIHGPSIDHARGVGALQEALSKWTDKLYRFINDMPTDKASRFPFFDLAYKEQMQGLVRAQDLAGGGARIPVERIHQLEDMARERALSATKRYLYDTTTQLDITRLTRLAIPFSSAAADTMLKWTRIQAKNPFFLPQMWHWWTMPERAGLIQDENGNHLTMDGTKEIWTDPEGNTIPLDRVGSNRLIQIRLPSVLGGLVGKKYFGVDMAPALSINKDNLNVFLNMPTTGPFVAIPANAFAIKNPEFGDNPTVKKFILPFGPTSSPLKAIVPSTVRSAWEAFNNEDGSLQNGQALAIFQAEMVNFNLGKRTKPPTWNEANDKASALKGLRFLTTFTSPINFQMQSPYKPYVDILRMMKAQDPVHADENFYNRYGSEYFALTMSVTKNAYAGVGASLASYKRSQELHDLLERYPDLAGLIVGQDGAGAFSKSVYEWQKQQPLKPGTSDTIRKVLSPEESYADMKRREGWIKYGKFRDSIDAEMVHRGLHSLNQAGSADLRGKLNDFVKQNKLYRDPSTNTVEFSPWYQDYTSTDRSTMERRIYALQEIVKDPRMQGRDDLRGMVDYLSLRSRLQEVMGYYGVKSVNPQTSTSTLGRWWNSQVAGLKDTNLSFAQLYNRWLEHDVIGV